MSNSPLIQHVRISPNKNSPRSQPIRKITIHHMAGNLSVEQCGNIFAQPSRQASSNYGIGSDGRIALYVDERDRSWCSSSPENDHQAITIEVANCTGAPTWRVSDAAMKSLIDLCVDICKRNHIPRLNFTGDKSGNLTMHKWFAPTECPGPYLESKFPYIAAEVNKRLSGGQTGWVQVGLDWYFYRNGIRLSNQWIKDGKWWYYLEPSGKMHTGYVKYRDGLYYCNQSRYDKDGVVVPMGACPITDSSGKIKGV